METKTLTAIEIERVWQQTSMKPLSNSIFRFASEVAYAEHKETLKAVGRMLRNRERVDAFSVYAIILEDEINALLRGEMPGEKKHGS